MASSRPQFERVGELGGDNPQLPGVALSSSGHDKSSLATALQLVQASSGRQQAQLSRCGFIILRRQGQWQYHPRRKVGAVHLPPGLVGFLPVTRTTPPGPWPAMTSPTRLGLGEDAREPFTNAGSE